MSVQNVPISQAEIDYQEKLKAERARLRDEFAMAAMRGLITRNSGTGSKPQAAAYASRAYEYADAMLKEREAASG
mgnify:CR=1 FL=1